MWRWGACRLARTTSRPASHRGGFHRRDSQRQGCRRAHLLLVRLGISLLLRLLVLLLLLLALIHHRLPVVRLVAHGQLLLDWLLLLLLQWLTIKSWLLHLRNVCLRTLHLLTWRISDLLLGLLRVKALIRMLHRRTRRRLRATLRQLLHWLLWRLIGILHAGLLRLLLLLLLHRVLRETSYDGRPRSSLQPACGVVIVSRSFVRWSTGVCLLCRHGLLLLVHWRLPIRGVGSRTDVTRSSCG